VTIRGEIVGCYIYPFLDIMEVMIRPNPNPPKIDPTKARGDSGKKKNPIPRPKSKPPPTAQLLLSSFFSVMPLSIIFYDIILYNLSISPNLL
jgi:hypothetical protein